MYIFELIAQIFRKNKNNITSSNNINVNEEDEECNHLFLPVDSTNTVFACKHCGMIITNDKLNNK